MIQIDATHRKEATKMMTETFYAAIFGYDEVRDISVRVQRQHRKVTDMLEFCPVFLTQVKSLFSLLLKQNLHFVFR